VHLCMLRVLVRLQQTEHQDAAWVPGALCSGSSCSRSMYVKRESLLTCDACFYWKLATVFGQRQRLSTIATVMNDSAQHSKGAQAAPKITVCCVGLSDVCWL
jgi:hypothetical protein